MKKGRGRVSRRSAARSPATRHRYRVPPGAAAPRLFSLLCAAALLLGVGCQDQLPAPSARLMALDDPGDAAIKDSLVARPGCGRFPPVGCCEGEALWWCDEGLLRGLNCEGRPRCGWSNAGFFDCNTSGQSDPSGNYSRNCPRDDAGNSTLPSLDGGGGDGAPGACSGIPVEGCCAGDELRYCLGGELRLLDCTLNRACGWKANGGLYDCGTGGDEDPAGNFIKDCPGAPDGRVDLAVDLEGADLGGDSAGDSPSDPGCTCGLPAGRDLPMTWLAAGLLLLLVLRRRVRRG